MWFVQKAPHSKVLLDEQQLLAMNPGITKLVACEIRPDSIFMAANIIPSFIYLLPAEWLRAGAHNHSGTFKSIHKQLCSLALRPLGLP